MRRKIAIIGTNGLPGRYGGWDQLMNHLIINLSDQYEFVVYTSSYNAIKGIKEVNGAKLKIIHLKANGWQSVLYDVISLLDSMFRYDILLVLGTSGCVALPFIRLFKKEIVLNPDGAEWKRGKWSKPVQWFLRFSEKLGVLFAKVIVSDNKIIEKYISDIYGKSSVLIEYGGDNAKYVGLREETALKYHIEEKKYAFKVCRIEPENNIDLILESFSKSTIKLILIGNWNFSDYGKNLRGKFAHFENILLLDPIYDQKQLDELIANCGLYIHGHSVGGTNPSLVEAMNLKLFCVVYDVSYNRETTENSAVYFSNSNDLSRILISYEQNRIDLNSYKSKMLEIAKRRYLWEIITDKYGVVFKNI